MYLGIPKIPLIFCTNFILKNKQQRKEEAIQNLIGFVSNKNSLINIFRQKEDS